MLTPEREKEIRKFLDNGSHGHPDTWFEDYKMFLAEIDRLRNDYRNSLRDTAEVLKERDRLGLKCEMLEKVISRYLHKS